MKKIPSPDEMWFSNEGDDAGASPILVDMKMRRRREAVKHPPLSKYPVPELRLKTAVLKNWLNFIQKSYPIGSVCLRCFPDSESGIMNESMEKFNIRTM